jgi:predicted O-methyltransferase YrrM
MELRGGDTDPAPMKAQLHFPSGPGPCELDQVTDADRSTLTELASGAKNIVEVGTFLGGSAEAILAGMPEDGHLTCIDLFEGTIGSPTRLSDNRISIDGKEIENDKEFSKYIALSYIKGRLLPYKDRVSVLIADSISASHGFSSESLDMVFIDAAHDYDNVLADIKAWLPKVKPNGILCGHDFDRFGHGCDWKDIVEYSQQEYTTCQIKDKKEFDGHEELLVTIVDENGSQVGWGVSVHFGVLRAVMECFKDVMLSTDISSSVWAVKPEWKKF